MSKAMQAGRKLLRNPTGDTQTTLEITALMESSETEIFGIILYTICDLLGSKQSISFSPVYICMNAALALSRSHHVFFGMTQHVHLLSTVLEI